MKLVKRLFNLLASLYKACNKVAGVLGGVAICCAALLIFTAVIARYVFHYGVIFAFDYSCYLAAFICFVGGAYTQSVKGHIKVNLVVVHLPGRAQQWLEAVTLALCFVVSSIFFYWVLVMAKTSFEFSSRAITAIHTPLVIPHSVIAVGLLWMSVVILVQFGAAAKRLHHRDKVT